MIPYNKLIQTEDFWIETIENYLYNKDVGGLTNEEVVKILTDKIMYLKEVILNDAN